MDRVSCYLTPGLSMSIYQFRNPPDGVKGELRRVRALVHMRASLIRVRDSRCRIRLGNWRLVYKTFLNGENSSGYNIID